MVGAYRDAWAAANEAALAASGPLLVVLGDSAAQGVGASAFDRGWVGQVLDRLREERDPAWRVLNLSVTGAQVGDVVADQLPRVPAEHDLLVSVAGGNDLLRGGGAFEQSLRTLLVSLPAGAVVGTMPAGFREPRARAANAIVRAVAAERGLVVADVFARTGPPWRGRYAADQFHPSDLGHRDWADAVAEALGLRVADPDRARRT